MRRSIASVWAGHSDGMALRLWKEILKDQWKGENVRLHLPPASVPLDLSELAVVHLKDLCAIVRIGQHAAGTCRVGLAVSEHVRVDLLVQGCWLSAMRLLSNVRTHRAAKEARVVDTAVRKCNTWREPSGTDLEQAVPTRLRAVVHDGLKRGAQNGLLGTAANNTEKNKSHPGRFPEVGLLMRGSRSLLLLRMDAQYSHGLSAPSLSPKGSAPAYVERSYFRIRQSSSQRLQPTSGCVDQRAGVCRSRRSRCTRSYPHTAEAGWCRISGRGRKAECLLDSWSKNLKSVDFLCLDVPSLFSEARQL